MQTAINLAFGDGEYVFKLPIKRIVEIEAKAGPIDGVRHRLMHGGFGVQDVVEIIRQGLIGGGKGMVSGVETAVSALKANSLIDAYVDGQPLAEIAITARAIIMALYVGYEPALDAQKKARRESRAGKDRLGRRPLQLRPARTDARGRGADHHARICGPDVPSPAIGINRGSAAIH